MQPDCFFTFTSVDPRTVSIHLEKRRPRAKYRSLTKALRQRNQIQSQDTNVKFQRVSTGHGSASAQSLETVRPESGDWGETPSIIHSTFLLPLHFLTLILHTIVHVPLHILQFKPRLRNRTQFRNRIQISVFSFRTLPRPLSHHPRRRNQPWRNT